VRTVACRRRRQHRQHLQCPEPDWTIEILSPEQSSTRVTSNILHCLDHGCQLGWLIDPDERLVQIYDPEKHLTSLETPADSLPVPPFADALHLTSASSSVGSKSAKDTPAKAELTKASSLT
jgi:Uma2 family endonuclease